MLRLSEIHAYYKESHILRGVSFSLERGQVVTLLGRNGAGKTTTVKTIMGLILPRSGEIELSGKNITGWAPHQIARSGIGFVPEERRIFPSLTVHENILLPLWGRGQEGWSLERIYSFFPHLGARSRNKGSQLSGGEQQMLAIARILRAKVELILLDEPTEGLAPMLVRSIGDIIKEIKKGGLTVLLIEQNTRFASSVADRHHVLYGGRIVYEASNEEFKANTEVQRKYLGV